MQCVTYSTSLQTSDLTPDLSEWLSCTWVSVQKRDENDRVTETLKVSANVSNRKALTTRSLQPKLVFSDPPPVDFGYVTLRPPVKSQHRAFEAFRQSTCLSNNSVFITSQLGGDLKREAGALINRRGRTSVKLQINKQAIILTRTYTRGDMYKCNTPRHTLGKCIIKS